MGVFSTVEVQTRQEGGYELSGIFHCGSHSNISETFYDIVARADSKGFDTNNIVSIYFNNPKQVPTDSLLTFIGVVFKDSSELAALSLDGLTQISLPKGDTIYLDFIYKNKMSHAVGPIVIYNALFLVSTEKG